MSSSSSTSPPDEVEKRPACPLPPWAADMVQIGHLHSTFVLSTIFAPLLGGGIVERPNPQVPQVGGRAEVRLPKAAKHLAEDGVVRPQLLGQWGEGFALACVWRTEDKHQGNCIHVVLQPAYRAEPPLLWDVQLTASPALFGQEQLSITTYVRNKLEALWLRGGLKDAFFGEGGLVHSYQDHLWIVSGVSHGATMAQAVACLFALEAKQRLGAGAPVTRLISWNGYRWTDKAGKATMLEVLQENQVNFVTATLAVHIPFIHGRPLEVDGVSIPKWDPTSGFPWTCVNVPGLYLLLTEDSRILPVESLPDMHPALRPKRWLGLHFARQYMKAVTGLNELYFPAGQKD